MKKNNKASAVEVMLGQGLTSKEIRARIDVSYSYIHLIQKKLAAKHADSWVEVEGPVQGDPNAVEPEEGLDAVLTERGSRYGKFNSHAAVTQLLKSTASACLKHRDKILAYDQQEALDMIFHKIGRILNGDPDYADSWIDIAGYAKLVADRLEGKIR